MQGIKDATVGIKVISGAEDQVFFGYYDLQPYDSTGKKHLAHRVQFIDRLPTKDDVCELGYIEVENGAFHKLAETTAWNFQQGAMLQWYRDDDHIVYNVRTSDGFGTQIKNIVTGETRTLPLATANISKDGKWGVCVNMSRIYDFRPGYGYSDLPDPFYNENAPAADGITLMNMETGEARQIISYEDMIRSFPEEPYSSLKLVVNHITFNPSGDRFLFLLRNFFDGKTAWKTQALTSDLDGNLCKLTDYINNSHYHWKNDKEILIVSNEEMPWKLKLIEDKSGKQYVFERPEFAKDIHCLYSPSLRFISGDGYPDKEQYRPLYLYEPQTNDLQLLCRMYSIPPSVVDIRCDLHARFRPDGKKLSFDSTHLGYRCICEIDLEDKV